MAEFSPAGSRADQARPQNNRPSNTPDSPRPDSPRPVRAADSVERVYQALKARAIDYRFRPGERINEVELAEALGVSRTPVRAALNRLERDGFVTAIPNKGFQARSLTPEAVRDLYELRAAIERAAFLLACQRASDSEIDAVAALWAVPPMPEGDDHWGRLALADEGFHLALAGLAKNAQMVATLESISSRIRFFRRIDLELSPRRDQSCLEHGTIIKALRRRDRTGGAELLDAHITLSSTHAMEVATQGLARIFFGTAA